MKIALTGGGTGGHFYPLIAVAEQIHALAEERKLLTPQLLYLGPVPFDREALVEQNIEHIAAPVGKVRRYRSVLNIFDFFRVAWGTVRSLIQLFNLYPDVIFSTGGYAAFPTLAAARILNIPVIVYDADAQPGRVSLWSSKFAQAIGVAHPDAAENFPRTVRERIARVGHPIRHELEHPIKEGGHEFLKLDRSVPTILVLGGSQGAQVINNAIIDALPLLIKKYNVVHQTGKANYDEVAGMARLITEEARYDNRYRCFGLLNALALRMSAGIASLVVSRAGSGTLFEIAAWGMPSIVIPIPEDVSHDQVRNAYSYARAGAAVVIEQKNLTPHILSAEIDRLLENHEELVRMGGAAQKFAQPDAAKKIARILLDVALEHTA